MNTSSAEPDPGTGTSEPLFTVTAGDPTPAELAAITAVVGEMVQELEHARRSAKASGPTGWQRSQRPVPVAIVPGPRAWRDTPW